ncbi:MAG: class IV adenylate cyclase [Chloroflexi bacterium]|nr:class IV adenylate cyclase [Chloroflexota bacterium]
MTGYTETEVKLYVPYLEAVQARLETIGAALVSPRVFERNVRYDNAERSLTPAGIVLRLRQDTRARLTYKAEGGETSGIVSRFEAEVEVSDFAAMETILGKLGYTPYMVYEKYRTTYELDGAEIVLDEMPYGNFVEIEGDAATIEKMVSRLYLQNAPRQSASYAALFERVRQVLGLTFSDLTFDNFKGLAVPESAFNEA